MKSNCPFRLVNNEEKNERYFIKAELCFILTLILFFMDLFCFNFHVLAQSVSYTYDESTSNFGNGRLTSISDGSGTTKFFYDPLGRITKINKVVDGTTYTVQKTYDLIGRVTAVGYPDGSLVKNDFNGPFLSRVYELSTIYIQFSGYNSLGQPTSVIYGDGTSTNLTFSNSGNSICPSDNFRLCTMATTYGAVPLQSLSYSYDAIGEIKSISDSVNTNGNQSYAYDDIGRLTSVMNSLGTLVYSYNTIGNMTCNSELSACSSTTPNYSYPISGSASIHPHAVTNAATYSYTYDANGNLISDNLGRSFTFDGENRPKSISLGTQKTSFIYDAYGGRVKRTSLNGSTTTYIGNIYECTAALCIKYIIANDKRIAISQIGQGTVYYYHSDHLGSTSIVTNSGSTAEAINYYPYGRTISDSGSISVSQKYTGQVFDADTGLYYYNARYYDPVLGRFISPDLIVGRPADPQSLNRYSYVRNNPIIYTDPTGNCWCMSEIVDSASETANRFSTWISDHKQTDIQIVTFVADAVAIATDNEWAIPYISGAGSGASEAARGGHFGEVLEATAVGYASGSAQEYGNEWNAGNPVDGAFVGGAFGGFTGSAGMTLVHGGNISDAIGNGGEAGVISGFGSGVTVAMDQYYKETVGYAAPILPGTGDTGYYNPDLSPYKSPPPNNDVSGFNENMVPGQYIRNQFRQGGLFGKFINWVLPGGHGISVFHDTIFNNGSIEQTWFNNIWTMPVAAVITYGSYLSGPQITQSVLYRTQ